MNQKQQLLNTIEMEQNRLIKGQEIVRNGLISKIENDIYLVKNEYEVYDLSSENSPIYYCSCKDYTFRPQYLCKHIHATILYQLEENGA